MENKNKVIVKINGQDYPIMGSESKEHLLRVGNFVDEKMELVSKNNSRLSTSMIAVLTCVNIADQFLKLQNHLDTVQREHVDPINKLEEFKEDYDVLLNELEEKREGLQFFQKQAEELMAYKEKAELENAELKEQLKIKEKDLANAENIINDLQNKFFENQIKLVELRKNLEEDANNNTK